MKNQSQSEADVMAAFNDFKSRHIDALAQVQEQVDNVEKIINRPGALGAAHPSSKPAENAAHFLDAKTGKRVPVLAHGQRLADLPGPDGAAQDVRNLPTIADQLHHLVLGSRASGRREFGERFASLGGNLDPTGGYSLQGAVARQWVDALRAEMVLSRAGALTLPMDEREVNIVKITSDPTPAWHAENAADISDTEPSFGAVKLTAKTLVVLVKFSLEIAQDSPNLGAMLQRSVIASMAAAIDRAGLVGVTTNAAIAPASGAGIFDLADRNTVTSIGAPTSWDFAIDGLYELMAADVPAERIGALIGHPKLWQKMRKLKTGLSGDNTPLTMPAEVAALPKLWTTAAPLTGGTTAKAIIADWRDLVFGIRQDITVRLLSETYMGDRLQVALLCHARCDFAATRAQSFVTLEDITV